MLAHHVGNIRDKSDITNQWLFWMYFNPLQAAISILEVNNNIKSEFQALLMLLWDMMSLDWNVELI